MEEAKGQSILDKMLTTFINTLVKAAENEAQTCLLYTSPSPRDCS